VLKFSINKEEVIFSKTFEIAKSVDESILKLQDLVKKVLEGDRGSLSADLVKIKAIYERVAMTREEVVSLLYGEAFLPDFKESMMMLNQALYNAIKAVQGFG
jgi:Phosphate transport regulator (distant homolog of PhoU)